MLYVIQNIQFSLLPCEFGRQFAKNHHLYLPSTVWSTLYVLSHAILMQHYETEIITTSLYRWGSWGSERMANIPTSCHYKAELPGLNLVCQIQPSPQLASARSHPRHAQALTEGVACKGCRLHPLWSSGAQVPGLPSFSPQWQPCQHHRAGPPDGTQLRTPPSPRCCPHMCCPSQAAAGSFGPGGGPADRCRQAEQGVRTCFQGPWNLPHRSSPYMF